MKLVVTDLTIARRHRLNALAVARADQPRNIDTAHPCARLVPESAHEGREPSIKIGLPGFFHGRPSAMPTTHESRKTRFGNPKKCQRPEKSAKVGLVDRIQHLAPASDGGDDFVGISGPSEGSGLLVVLREETVDRSL